MAVSAEVRGGSVRSSLERVLGPSSFAWAILQDCVRGVAELRALARPSCSVPPDQPVPQFKPAEFAEQGPYYLPAQLDKEYDPEWADMSGFWTLRASSERNESRSWVGRKLSVNASRLTALDWRR